MFLSAFLKIYKELWIKSFPGKRLSSSKDYSSKHRWEYQYWIPCCWAFSYKCLCSCSSLLPFLLSLKSLLTSQSLSNAIHQESYTPNTKAKFSIPSLVFQIYFYTLLFCEPKSYLCLSLSSLPPGLKKMWHYIEQIPIYNKFMHQ